MSKHVQPRSGSVFGRIDVGAEFKATYSPLGRLLNRKNMLSRNTAEPNPVTYRSLGFEAEFVRQGLLATQDVGSSLDRGFTHKREFNAQIVTPVNAESARWGADTAQVTPDTRKTFWQRLQEAFREAQLPTSGNAIAELLRMSQGSVNRWQQDKGLPELDTVRDLALRSKVSVEWLLTGRGPKKPLRFDEETQELLAAWTELNENGRHHVRMAAQSARALQAQSERPAREEA